MTFYQYLSSLTPLANGLMIEMDGRVDAMIESKEKPGPAAILTELFHFPHSLPHHLDENLLESYMTNYQYLSSLTT